MDTNFEHFNDYLFENKNETVRLELKTDISVVEKQARWAGLKQGMTVLDIGCGGGKSTLILSNIAGPGHTTGIDMSAERILFAANNYASANLEFIQRNIFENLTDLGKFDFIWMRFFLEYYEKESFEIIKKAKTLLKPNGVLCLIDLDYNSLTHFGTSKRLAETISDIMQNLQQKHNFDPYIGRKLYSFLYGSGFTNIKVDVSSHHLLYGDLDEKDAFNWHHKLETIAKKINFVFSKYPGGYSEFEAEFKDFLSSPERFTYSPLISCCGIKPD